MSLKKNILSNYVSQIYITIITIAIVPMYVRYMGAEAYGLVGFFAMLQAWFQLLDIGLTPTMTREAARFQGGAIDALSFQRLLRILEALFLGIALLGGVAMATGSGLIASRWLKVQQLPLSEVRHAIILMAAIISLRWVCGLYRSVVFGFDRIAWLGVFNILVATARFGLVIPLFHLVGTTPTIFFEFQLAIGVPELGILVWKTYRMLPPRADARRIPWDWRPLWRVIGFALSIAFTSSIWVLVTQTDKLVLSKFLPLKDYGYFSLAVMAASGIMIVSGPIGSALLPRMAILSAEGNEDGLIRLYRNATQLATVIAVPTALVLAFFAEPVLVGWTGNLELAHRAAPVLRLYALGNGFIAIGGISYSLQFVKGDLKLHIIGSGLLAVVLVPSLVWATWHYGLLGPGYAWLGANALYFLLWVPKVHRRFVKGLHSKWLIQDIFPIVAVTLVAAALAAVLIRWPAGRVPIGSRLALVSVALLVAASTGSSWVRNRVSTLWRGKLFAA